MLTLVLSSMIYALPISVICAAQLFPLFCPEDAAAGPWIATAVFLAICAFFRHGSLKVRLIIIAVVLALSAGLFFAVDSTERREFFTERSWVALILLISLGVFVVSELLARFRSLRIAAAVLVFAGCVYLIITGIDPGSLTCAMLLSIILSTVIREVQHYWKKEGDTDGNRHIVSILPFIILCALLVAVAPVSDDPYDWPVAHRLWQFAKETATKISQFFSSDDYMDTTIGFSSGDAALHSSLSADSTPEEMFTVSFKRKDTPSLNLGACGYNEFNGRAWTNTVDEAGSGRRHQLDTLETRSSILSSSTENIFDHMRSVEASVTYTNLNTRYALVPTKYQDVLSQGALLDTLSDSDNTVFADKRGLGTSYSFSAIMLNKSHQTFIDFMNATGEPVSEKAWYDSIAGVLINGRSEYPYEEYLAYVDNVKKNYMREVNVSPALREKLDVFYEGCKGSYEKMLRLEAILSQLTYTISPGALPDWVDSSESFLDWFMLENPRGYCSHFATAMVLLARAEGLPARYVEGFCVPSSSQGGTKVTDREAHSWVEIYFEGFGFIAFDPTPGYVTETGWQTTSERSAYLATLSKGTLDAFLNMDPVDPAAAEDPEEEIVPGETSPALILIPLLCSALLLPAAILLYKAIMRKRFNKLSTADKTVYLCHSNMRLMRFLGTGIRPGETLSEFAGRAACDIPGELIDFVSVYEEISYSDRAVSDDMLSVLMRSNRDLCSFASKKRRIAYIFYSLFTT